MPKTKGQKQFILQELDQKVKDAKSMVFLKFDKLTVVENEDLRKKLKSEKAEYMATKKTFLNLTLKNNNLEEINARSFAGQVAAIFGFGDEVSPAKIASVFAKDKKEKIEFLGGVLENKFINAEQVKSLASLPSKQELYAKLVGTLNAPINGFVNILAGNLRGLVTVLKAIEEKKAV